MNVPVRFIYVVARCVWCATHPSLMEAIYSSSDVIYGRHQFLTWPSHVSNRRYPLNSHLWYWCEITLMRWHPTMWTQSCPLCSNMMQILGLRWSWYLSGFHLASCLFPMCMGMLVESVIKLIKFISGTSYSMQVHPPTQHLFPLCSMRERTWASLHLIINFIPNPLTRAI